MTLILSAISAGWTYQVSDRQATRLGAVWDGAWNKTVVVATDDAVAAMSFWGAAFLGRKPIDEWATETMSGAGDMGGSMLRISAPPSTAGLSRVLQRLVDGLNAWPDAAARGQVHACLVGWRIAGGHLRSFCYELTSRDDKNKTIEIHRLTKNEGVSHRWSLFAHPPGWTTQGRLETLAGAFRATSVPEERERTLIEYIREVHASGAPVGPHAMCIRIPAATPIKPTIRFAPADPHLIRVAFSGRPSFDLPVAHTPAFVTPGVQMLTSIVGGPPPTSVGGLELDWDVPLDESASSRGTYVGIMSSVVRKSRGSR